MTTPTDRTRRPFVMDEAVALLARTPASLDALLRGLPDGWIAAHEGGETWSPFDVIGHLIHGEQTDWMPRARIILDHGDGLPDGRQVVCRHAWRVGPEPLHERASPGKLLASVPGSRFGTQSIRRCRQTL
jgi:hypothetical protein